MDASHGIVALIGVASGWWFYSSKETPKSDPSACHCICSVKPEVKPDSDHWWLLGGIVVVVLLLGANLALAFKVTVRHSDSGDREYSFSFKGKQGKGVYGGTRGLQILDR